jgi:hypothetical protein
MVAAILLVVAVLVPQCALGSTFAARRKVNLCYESRTRCWFTFRGELKCETNSRAAAGMRELRDDSNHSGERQSIVGALDALRFFAAPFQGPEAPAKWACQSSHHAQYGSSPLCSFVATSTANSVAVLRTFAASSTRIGHIGDPFLTPSLVSDGPSIPGS